VRVIFLDFDGVLNADTDDGDSAAVDELWSAAWLDRAMVERLSDLAQRGGARVVISSSWRQRRSREELAEMLASLGFDGEVIDITPRLPRPESGERTVREQEVKAWLDAHGGVESFVILDDDQEFGALSDHHVRTDSKVGLTARDVEHALAILSRRR
jgi:hypothetical protein